MTELFDQAWRDLCRRAVSENGHRLRYPYTEDGEGMQRRRSHCLHRECDMFIEATVTDGHVDTGGDAAYKNCPGKRNRPVLVHSDALGEWPHERRR